MDHLKRWTRLFRSEETPKRTFPFEFRPKFLESLAKWKAPFGIIESTPRVVCCGALDYDRSVGKLSSSNRQKLYVKKYFYFTFDLTFTTVINSLDWPFSAVNILPHIYIICMVLFNIIDEYKFTEVYCESVNLIGYIIVCYLLLVNSQLRLLHF